MSAVVHSPARSSVTGELMNRPLTSLLAEASALRNEGHGTLVTYSRKVFIPLTMLCRDVCHYCTFARTPRHLAKPFLDPEDVLEIATNGAEQGCKEALFTLGDKPELRYRAARDALDRLGFETTVDYLESVARQVHDETGLLPHLNPGVLSEDEWRRLRTVAPSMGIMLETASDRLSAKGMPHHGSPDKDPATRLASIAAAGRAQVPLTSGILIGIGETRRERIESLQELLRLHDEYGHIQEIIVQNFVPKPDTLMRDHPAPAFEELLWTIAVARILAGPRMSIQVPPNLNAGRLEALISAGINDWGGVSPVTPDHVNPESPWPHLDKLESETAAAGHDLVERLTVYGRYIKERDDWIHPAMIPGVLSRSDTAGLARTCEWHAGDPQSKVPARVTNRSRVADRVSDILARWADGELLSADQITALFSARRASADAVIEAADRCRQEVCGDTVSYVVNRNINYTNLCTYRCTFCAFSKGKRDEDLRGSPYVIDRDEIIRRTREAWARGATEVCMQGGIHPAYTGETYLDIVAAVKEAAPDMHVHAFSPLEIQQGASTLGLPIARYLEMLNDAGLGTLPGTAAEILVDAVRDRICPDKLRTDAWLDIMATAHRTGLKTTATIMFGHVEGYGDWAMHLIRIRDQQRQTGGFTEFVPLPFVHMEAPMFRRGQSRMGPTFREVLLMHAVSRLVLHPWIANIQTSWTKLGETGAVACLDAGANDVGGTLMNESISRAAGASHGQELRPEAIEAMLEGIGRTPRQRTTLYADAPDAQKRRAASPADLEDVVNRPAVDFQRVVASRGDCAVTLR